METSKQKSDICDDNLNEILQFSLVNPDELSQQLDAANLDDEETDHLLQEALKLNAQLKEKLRDQNTEKGIQSGTLYGKGERMKTYRCQHLAVAQQTSPEKHSLPAIGCHFLINRGDNPRSESCRAGVAYERTFQQREVIGNKDQEACGRTTSVDKRLVHCTTAVDKRLVDSTTSVDKRATWDNRFSYS